MEAEEYAKKGALQIYPSIETSADLLLTHNRQEATKKEGRPAQAHRADEGS